MSSSSKGQCSYASVCPGEGGRGREWYERRSLTSILYRFPEKIKSLDFILV